MYNNLRCIKYHKNSVPAAVYRNCVTNPPLSVRNLPCGQRNNKKGLKALSSQTLAFSICA